MAVHLSYVVILNLAISGVPSMWMSREQGKETST